MTSPSSPEPRAAVNGRVLADGQHYGTIKYVGPVPRTTGGPLWYGIEWDDAQRGRHDGKHAGETYFAVREPGSGSFVRVPPADSPAAAKLDFGRGFVEALEERYTTGVGERDAADAAAGKDQLDRRIAFGANTRVLVETVGWAKIERKQKQLDRLEVVGLSGQRIAFRGANGDPSLTALCPNVADLDLSRNLLGDWRNVAQIAGELPRLACLRLAFNRFAPAPDALSGFEHVTRLVLNHTYTSWVEALRLQQAMPALETLQLAFNGISDLGPVTAGSPAWPSLKRLNLEGNALTNWDDLTDHLGHVQHLESLALTGNCISRISYRPQTFQALQTLLVNGNPLDNWASVDALDAFPALCEVRVRDCPVANAVQPLENLLVVLTGRLARMLVINGCAVSPRDRADAEKYYLVLAAREAVAAGVQPGSEGASAWFSQHHPRVGELERRYGALDASSGAAVATPESSTLRDNMLELALCLPDGARVARRFPPNMSVRNLQLVLSRLLAKHRLSVDARLHLVAKYRDAAGGGETAMDDPLKELSLYGLESGDAIIVGRDGSVV